MLQGPAIYLYKKVTRTHPTYHLIASGGVSCIEDIEALDNAGIPAVVFGKAIYEGKIDLETTEGGIVKFDLNGQRIMYYNCYVEVIEKIE
jgi:phosphoribosylformimino-5-aminoimidazole carboxamide ribonucleotide (ProFAR) isomerase